MKKAEKKSIPSGFLALIVLVIFISGIATMLVSGHNINALSGKPAAKNTDSDAASGASAGDSTSGLSSQAVSPNAYEEKSNLPADYRLITVLNEDVYKGSLILVNYRYQSMIDGENLVNIYDNASNSIGVKDDDMLINESIVEPINSFFDEFKKAQGPTSILISSSYRSKEAQTKIYKESVKRTGEQSTAYYVAVPGYSEHQTGYCFDTAAYNYNGEMIELDGEGEYEWLTKNCQDYGFILRYPHDKTNITGIGYEAWHFRYVGVPHATFIMDKKLCFEEYIEGLRDYTFDKGGLLIDKGTKGKWIVYYVPKLEAFNNTDVPVPADSKKCPYTVSGNNIDGFIVTVDVTNDTSNSLLSKARSDWSFDSSSLVIADFKDYDPDLDPSRTSDTTSDGDSNGNWESDPFWDDSDGSSTESDAEDYESRFDYVDYYDEVSEATSSSEGQ